MSCLSCCACCKTEPKTPPPTRRTYSPSSARIDAAARILVRSQEVDQNLNRQTFSPPHRQITLLKDEAKRIKKDIDLDEKLNHHRRAASRII